jgi:hypothetical protein
MYRNNTGLHFWAFFTDPEKPIWIAASDPDAFHPESYVVLGNKCPKTQSFKSIKTIEKITLSVRDGISNTPWATVRSLAEEKVQSKRL